MNQAINFVRKDDSAKKECSNFADMRKFASEEFHIPIADVVMTDLKKGDVIEDTFKLIKPFSVEVWTQKEIDEIIKTAAEEEEEEESSSYDESSFSEESGSDDESDEGYDDQDS